MQPTSGSGPPVLLLARAGAAHACHRHACQAAAPTWLARAAFWPRELSPASAAAYASAAGSPLLAASTAICSGNGGRTHR